MKGNYKNLQGQLFGKLIATKRVCKNGKNSFWECICECGKNCIVSTGHLQSGHTKSCGCLAVNNLSQKTHGKTKTRLYRIWSRMKQRCYDKNDISYQYYGKRNIVVCDEWRNSFECFYSWAINNGYSEDLTIDRIDVNKDYSPENCKFSTDIEQANNKRNNKILTLYGKSQTMANWAREINVSTSTIHARLKKGWSVERALTEETNIKYRNKLVGVEING